MPPPHKRAISRLIVSPSSAAVLTAGGAIGLLECLKNELPASFDIAIPGVLTGKR